MKAKEKLARNLDEIRELYATGNYRHSDLAKKYNVCNSSMAQFAKIHGLKKPDRYRNRGVIGGAIFAWILEK